jgi:hypothetical protein
MTTYEIRSAMNTPIFTFDNLTAAEVELRKSQKTVAVPLRLVEVRRVEREIVPSDARRVIS